MNTTTRTIGAVGLSALAALGLATAGAVAASAAPTSTTIATSVTADDDLAETLAYMRDEERLARDLYAAIAELYDGARPFSNITNSEDHHYDAVGVLLERYDIDDPSDGMSAGTFVDEELQAMYDDLLAEAETSLAAAYEVGITVEETDIDDLEAALTADFPDDVDAVLENLLNGSENHLAAFTAAADGTTAAGTGMGGRSGNGQGMGGNAQDNGNAQGNGNGNGNGNAQGSANGAAVSTRADGECLLMQ